MSDAPAEQWLKNGFHADKKLHHKKAHHARYSAARLRARGDDWRAQADAYIVWAEYHEECKAVAEARTHSLRSTDNGFVAMLMLSRQETKEANAEIARLSAMIEKMRTPAMNAIDEDGD
jgi:hypothetical protein